MPARKIKLRPPSIFKGSNSASGIAVFIFFFVIMGVERKIKQQQNGAGKKHFRQDMRCPEKRDAVQKPEKQGRISQRGQRTADVTDQKIKKTMVCTL